jgi:hypothetical protein
MGKIEMKIEDIAGKSPISAHGLGTCRAVGDLLGGVAGLQAEGGACCRSASGWIDILGENRYLQQTGRWPAAAFCAWWCWSR